MESTDPRSAASDELYAALRRTLPVSISVGVRAITLADERDLLPSERAVTERARPQRQAEFATGRALLRALTGTTAPIERRRDGAPDLPPDVTGSLAHDRELAVGVVAARTDFSAIGIDVEPIADLDDGEAHIVLRSDDVAATPLEAVVMKEATYKAWSRRGRRLLEPADIRINAEGARFRSIVLVDGSRFKGLLVRSAGRCCAVAVDTQ